MKQVKCASCDGTGNHGLDKRGQRIGCRSCHGSGETDPTPEDLQKESAETAAPRVLFDIPEQG